jgi:uncharacterized membrane protein (UPF0136 family)
MTDNSKPTPQMIGALVKAGVYEALCCVAGAVGYFVTGKAIWIVMGILAGLGFSVPAIITLREARERDRASR